MTQEIDSNQEGEESVRHAEWVREHPRIDDSGFPEYPDEPSRRGSSRGAVPNGNPWHAVDPDEKPGRPEWDADTVPASLTPQHEPGAAADAGPAQSVDRPAPSLGEPTHRPAIISAHSDADARIGHDIGDVLANSKVLDGRHILVEIVDGEVYLQGTVADQSVKSEVEQLASSVRGAEKIHNELGVRS
jgi:BON domain-containing protein